jgi:transcriptional regulator with XRE-family HTH domain
VAADNIVSLGERLKQRREELGLSQVQAARELDVARTAYRLWEMEAARPAPDRWRLIARWLGISVATMLLAEELIDRDEAADIEDTHGQFNDKGEWDRTASLETGDFFAQERSLIAREAEAGMLTGAEVARLGETYGRVKRSSIDGRTRGWRRAELVKALPADPEAPGLGRAAVRVAAAGIAEATMEDAELLTSELVTDSVRRAAASSEIVLHIVVARDAIRIEVTDPGAKAKRSGRAGPTSGPAMALVAEIASRWGAERDDESNRTWFELDIPPPGTTT